MNEQTFVLPTEDVRAQVLSQSGQCERLVREHDRRAITGVSRTQWWTMERQGLVPKRVKLSAPVWRGDFRICCGGLNSERPLEQDQIPDTWYCWGFLYLQDFSSRT